MFYLFNQVNSGGFFVVDEKVTQNVIIEATSADDANIRAETIGIYFDGVNQGEDCECCGDRWGKVSDDDGTDEPLLYDKPPEEFSPWFLKEGVVYCRVFFLNGNVKEYVVPNDNKERLKKKTEKMIESYRMMLN